MTKEECQEHDWERGDIVDREGSSLIREYHCLNCDQTFTEAEPIEERTYDWSDSD